MRRRCPLAACPGPFDDSESSLVARSMDDMTSPGFIALLDLSTSTGDRATALAQLDRERPVVEAMAGCLGFRPFASRDDDVGITLVHEWVDQSSFDDYLASDAFARSGKILRPLLAAPPTSRRFLVESIETVR